MKRDDEVQRKAELRLKRRGQGGKHFEAAAQPAGKAATRGKEPTGVVMVPF